MSRPKRSQFVTAQGKTITLSTDAQSFEELLCLGEEAVLFMGVGPDPANLSRLVGQHRQVYWCEHPDFLAQLETLCPKWQSCLPNHWQRIVPEDLPSFPVPGSIFFYRQNTQLFPEFWGPLRARMLARSLTLGHTARTQSIILPGDEHSLLIRELAAAFTAEGFYVHCLHPAHMDTALPALLKEQRPAFCLSVNLRGLDPKGDIFHLLSTCEVPVAIWMVDNPWHLVSSLPNAWWTHALLLVTDKSFLPALKAAGATKSFHLPLACNPDWAQESRSGHDFQLKQLLFVGRSSFPGRKRFFAASRIEPQMLREAKAMLANPDTVPHFHWWMQRLGIERPWPGHEVRRAGLGAEECSLARRSQWLHAALPFGLTIYGDEQWREILPESVDLRAAVDYYATLPKLYAQARYSLNITSLLLPCGLSQRHFDVWIAGGFLLTDATPGLEIFPSDLWRESALSHHKLLKKTIMRFESDAALRRNLQDAWRYCLRTQHTYRHRAQLLCELFKKTQV